MGWSIQPQNGENKTNSFFVNVALTNNACYNEKLPAKSMTLLQE